MPPKQTPNAATLAAFIYLQAKAFFSFQGR
jgi:hypothetical protein